MINSDNEHDNVARILSGVENLSDTLRSTKNNSANQGTSGNIPHTPNEQYWDTVDFSLSEQLLENEYHPVLIYGTRASGKTTLLTSLFAYMNFDLSAPGTCKLGKEIIPQNSDYGRRVLSEARDIFENDVPNFYRGITAKSTRLETPIFIPLEFIPRSTGAPVKIAFMESQGEFYHVDSENRKGEIQLKKEVLDIYKYYPEGLSIILVAPYSLSSRYEDVETSDIEKRELESSDQSLYASLLKYNEMRAEKYKSKDRFIFILTKWDEFTQGPNNENFLDPTEELVVEQIAQKFDMSWPYFQSLPKSIPKNSMHYCAGIISGSDKLPTPAQYKRAMSKFPSSLWRWIYDNATTSLTPPEPDRGQSLLKNTFRKLFG
jgi:hypothetical protein